MSDDYKIGYGKPPRANQFKPGQSGNRAGRKKGSKNFATMFEAAMNDKVVITLNGAKKKVTKMEAALMQQANKAAGGDAKAMKLIMDILADVQIREARGVGVEADTSEDKKAHHTRVIEILRARFAEVDDGAED